MLRNARLAFAFPLQLRGKGAGWKQLEPPSKASFFFTKMQKGQLFSWNEKLKRYPAVQF